MEFKEAMRIWKRMCETHDDCDGCPMRVKGACESLIVNYDEHRMEAILAKRAAEHPEKTIMDDFFEKHPKALKRDSGITPRSCAVDLGYVEHCANGGDCAACWRRPLEEVEG